MRRLYACLMTFGIITILFRPLITIQVISSYMLYYAHVLPLPTQLCIIHCNITTK